MPPKRKPKGIPGKFLPNSSQQAGQGQRPINNSNVDSAVKRAQGMEEERKNSRKTNYVDLGLGAMEEEINLNQEVVGATGLKGDIQQVIANAVQAAVSAAMPSIIKAVTEACVASLRERVDPLFCTLSLR